MKLSTVLASIKSDQEKTASVQPPADARATVPSNEKTASAASTTAEKLKAALKEATASAPASGAEKTAAAASPIDGLTKIAASVAHAEHEALAKEAQLYGAAVCDGFMVRLAQYNEAAEKIAGHEASAPAKTAGEEGSFEKFAQANPELVKQAAEVGYTATIGQLEKLAEAAWQKGHDEGTQAIYKAAHATFVNGYRDGAELLEALK